jgi:hypothetical protein
VNSRFFGAWLLDSYEAQRADGTVMRPWGDDPIGIVCWDPSGYFAFQLGSRRRDAGDYLSWFGTAEIPDGESGSMTLRPLGFSAATNVRGDQVRTFLFLEPGLLRMRPPQGADGVQRTYVWRRAIARA